MPEYKFTVELTAEYPNHKYFFANNPGATIISIDGNRLIGFCECCAAPIVKGDLAYVWFDSIYTCQSCGGFGAAHELVRL